jgi:hypothetical protein
VLGIPGADQTAASQAQLLVVVSVAAFKHWHSVWLYDQLVSYVLGSAICVRQWDVFKPRLVTASACTLRLCWHRKTSDLQLAGTLVLAFEQVRHSNVMALLCGCEHCLCAQLTRHSGNAWLVVTAD